MREEIKTKISKAFIKISKKTKPPYDHSDLPTVVFSGTNIDLMGYPDCYYVRAPWLDPPND